MVRLQLMSRNMNQTILEDEHSVGLYEAIPSGQVSKELQEHIDRNAHVNPHEQHLHLSNPQPHDYHRYHVQQEPIGNSLPKISSEPYAPILQETLTSGRVMNNVQSSSSSQNTSGSSSASTGNASSCTNGNGNSSNNTNTATLNQQHYCLRWNNHHHNLLGVLDSVLSSEQHADISLFCEGYVIRVHKLVLLASSYHFERILESLPVGHQPVIILEGTKYADIRALVDYMYRGEVNIEQEQLTSLLKTAEALKIKGLADVAKKEDDRGGGRKENGRSSVGAGENLDRIREDYKREVVSSPPSKRAKNSLEDIPVTSRECRDSKDLRDTRDTQNMCSEPRDLSRDSRDNIPPLDIIRDLPVNFPLNTTSGSFPNLHRVNSPPPQLPPASTLSSARSLLYNSSLISRHNSKSPLPTFSSNPYFSGPLIPRSRSPHPQFESAGGSSLHPPASSPHSPLPDKTFSQLGMSPFGLPFSLPMLQESKKMLDRATHKLLPSPYDLPREDRDKDYHPPWPPNGTDADLNHREFRDKENAKWERDKPKSLLTERLLSAAQQHQTELHHSTNLPPLNSLHLVHNNKSRSQHSPIKKQPPFPKLLQKLDLLDKASLDTDKRIEDEKFTSSSSPEKDTSFSPPDDNHSFSSKADCTPEGEDGNEDEDSSTGSLRDGIISSATVDTTHIPNSETRNNVPNQNNNTPSTPIEMVTCPYCPRSYRHQNNLRTHIRCFHKGVRIPCPICHRGFTRWFTVRCHIAREHQNVDVSRPENLPAQLRRALYPPFSD